MTRKTSLALLFVVVPALTFVSSWALAAAKEDFKFTDVRQHTAAFHQYDRTIKLTPAQQAIYREALEGLPAPCCQDNTALTCCCPCNSARAWWGLAKHLVADLGYDARKREPRSPSGSATSIPQDGAAPPATPPMAAASRSTRVAAPG